VLEAMADFNLWVWHAAFGFAGGLNDLNIWENSLLLDDMVSGAFSAINFPFEVGGRVLVDGIYPDILCFARSISIPTGRDEKRYSGWKEAARKEIECAFGVLQHKFQIITHPIEKWDESRIKQTVHACILLHNMMVQEQIDNDKDLDNFQGMYDAIEDNSAATNEEDNANTDNEDDSNTNIEREENINSDVVEVAPINDSATEHVQQVEAEVLH